MASIIIVMARLIVKILLVPRALLVKELAVVVVPSHLVPKEAVPHPIKVGKKGCIDPSD